MGLIKKHTEGSLKLNGSTVSQTGDATLTITVNSVPTTAIGESWERNLELSKGWELSFTCNYEPLDTAQAAVITAATSGSSTTFTAIALYDDLSGVYTGTGCVLQSVGVTKSVGSPDKFAVSLKGNGTLTRTAGST